MDLRTPLGKVKGLGSAKEGGHHWLMQRLTGLALVGLVIWFVSSVIKMTKMGGETVVADLLASPMAAVMMLLFILVSLYHGCLGLKVIIEDYVSCPCGKLFLLVLVNFISIVTAAAVTLAIIYAHVEGYKGKSKYAVEQNFNEHTARLNKG